jgi:hypothetical protein
MNALNTHTTPGTQLMEQELLINVVEFKGMELHP